MTQRVLFFHYVLTNAGGETLDSSREGEPLGVLEGAHQIIPGLETELFQMNTGEKKTVHVPAVQAYGPVSERLKVKVNRAKLPAGDLQIGTQFRGGPEEHAPVFVVFKIEGEDVYLDGNHPLAGQDLTFAVEIMIIREATAEELEHGHGHGPEGHGHSH